MTFVAGKDGTMTEIGSGRRMPLTVSNFLAEEIPDPMIGFCKSWTSKPSNFLQFVKLLDDLERRGEL